MAPALPLFSLKVLAAGGAVSANPGRLMAVLAMGAGADWLLEFTNDADGLGTNIIEIGGQAEGGQTFFDFTNIGGIMFSSKCYCAITDTSGQFFFWYDGIV